MVKTIQTFQIPPLEGSTSEPIATGQYRVKATVEVGIYAGNEAGDEYVVGTAAPGSPYDFEVPNPDWSISISNNDEAETASVTLIDLLRSDFNAGTTFRRPKLTRLMLSGIDLPAGSDMDISCTLRPIGGASNLVRTVNADLINMSRQVFRKYAASITGSDLHTAALAHLMPGDYLELVPFERLAISPVSPSVSVTLPRSGIDVLGITEDGRKIEPITQPATPLPLQTARTPVRIAMLREKPTVEFPEPVASVRYRAALACLVVDWSTDADERMASSSWGIELEEV